MLATTSPAIGQSSTTTHKLCQTMPAPLAIERSIPQHNKEGQGVRVAKDLLQ